MSAMPRFSERCTMCEQKERSRKEKRHAYLFLKSPPYFQSYYYYPTRFVNKWVTKLGKKERSNFGGFFWFGRILGSASRAEFPVSLSNHVGFTPRLLYSSTHDSSESFIVLKTGWAQEAWLQWSHENWYFHLWHQPLTIKTSEVYAEKLSGTTVASILILYHLNEMDYHSRGVVVIAAR